MAEICSGGNDMTRAEYAAQPICYAAVVDGGSTRLGARVIQSMMNQLVDGKYGFSTCNATREKQLQEWIRYLEKNFLNRLHIELYYQLFLSY